MAGHRTAEEAALDALRAHLDDARATLAAVRVPADERVHDARKAIKRARAVLRLLRPALGDRRFRALDRALRDAGRLLARMRDAKVMAETLAAHLRRSRLDLAPYAALADALRRERTQAAVALHGPAGERDARQAIDRVRRAVATVARSPADPTGAPASERRARGRLADGLRRIYRRARRACAAASAARTPEALHEWRKTVKTHADALEACPTAVGRSHGSRRRSELRGLRALARLLGDDHDAAVLAARITAGDVASVDRDRLLATLERRRDRLADRAFAEGRSLYRRKPRAYVKAELDAR